MTGTLYTVSKKPNSTAQPTGTGTGFTFRLKGACSVQAPVLSLFSGGPLNLFNTEERIVGFYMSQSGTLASNASYCCSDYIRIAQGVTYTLHRGQTIGTAQRYINVFDANYNRLGAISGPTLIGDSTFSSSYAGTAYCRVNYMTTDQGNISIVGGSGGTPRMPTGNYLYIPSFGRYYWVDDMSYELGEWTLRCRCDVLATYKTAIGNSSQYVLRSASSYDDTIIDSLYPTKAQPSVIYTPNTPTIFNSTGCYVLGVIGGTGTHITAGQARGMTYYIMDDAHLAAFANYANSWTAADAIGQDFISNVTGTTIDALSRQLLKVYDYVKSCVWIPVSDSSIVGTNLYKRIALGGFLCPLSNGSGKEPATYNVTGTVCSFTVPYHLDYATLGPWTCAAPYSSHYIDVPFLGEYPLPLGTVTSGDLITVEMDLSIIDGSCQFFIKCTPGGTGTPFILDRVQAMVGASVPINVIQGNYIGTGSSAVGAVASALTGNFVGAMAGIADAVSNAIPSPKTVGGLQGFHVSEYQGGITSTFWRPVDSDNTSHGRPLCQVKTISSLSGYVLCENAEITISGTAEEADEIINFMKGGFYYE